MPLVDLKELNSIIRQALAEDIGKGDITTRLIMPADRKVNAIILAKESYVVCGIIAAGKVFKTVDNKIKFKIYAKDGEFVKKGRTIAIISGHARGILAAERVALNLLSLLSGVATKTREYVRAVRPYKAKITDTRKTIPGLRSLEKYAVRIGGGYNHRMGLDKMILIKDNHLMVVGKAFWDKGIKQIRSKVSKKMEIEIEVKTLVEFKKALQIKPDVIMLDNMDLASIKKAVLLRNKFYGAYPKLEASGGITLKNIKKIASLGVDMISVGALTHSINATDISLEFLIP